MKRIVSLLLTLALLATFALFAIGSGSSSDDTKVEPAATGEQAEQANDAGNAASSRTEIRAGETLNMNEFKVTFDSAEKWVSDNEFITPTEGKMFIRLHFTVVNDTSSDQTVGAYAFDCYADGEKCETSYYGDDMLSFDSISAGRKTSGYVYFEVPESANEIEVEYETNFWSDKKAFFIVELG